jgi:probable F420-dependent oxidoreductase
MQFTLSIGFCPTEWYLPLAVAAEEAGFDSIAVPDGLFYYETVSTPYPYSPDGSRFWSPETEFLDPFVVITAMAAVTKRIRFYPSVLKLAVREPLLVAKELSSCAVLSGGRIGLGAGLSPWPEDFEVLRQEWANRGPRSAEMIEIIRGLMSGDYFGYEGQMFQMAPIKLCPVPTQPVPILIGGHADAALKRAARIGDGWISAGTSLEELDEFLRKLHGFRAEYGREKEPFEIQNMGASAYTPDGVKQLEDRGVHEVIVAFRDVYKKQPDPSLEEKLATMRWYADNVIAKSR